MGSTSEIGQDAAYSIKSEYFNIGYENIAYLSASLDVSLGLLSGFIGYYIYSLSDKYIELDRAVGVGAVNGLLFVLIGAIVGIYTIPYLTQPYRAASKAALSWFISLLLVISILFVLRETWLISRGNVLANAAIFAACVALSRLIAARVLRRAIAQRRILGRRVVILGDQQGLADLSSRDLLLDHELQEVARVELPRPKAGLISAESAAQAAQHAMGLARQRHAEEIAMAVAWSNLPIIEGVAEQLRASPLPVRLLPDQVIKSVVGRRGQARMRPAIAVQLQRAPLSRSERLVKRTFDVTISFLALLLLAPLLVVVAIAIKLDCPGPVIFRQRRTGFDGHPFTIYKFRTMNVIEDGDAIIQARRNDFRVTRIGRALRRSSIDELPQLLNVLIGDMSLVGPRPHALAHDHHYSGLLSEYAARHNVKPGISGWAQVNGSRGETVEVSDMRKRIELDLWYIDNWSIVIDCLILFRTFISLLAVKAY